MRGSTALLLPGIKHKHTSTSLRSIQYLLPLCLLLLGSLLATTTLLYSRPPALDHIGHAQYDEAAQSQITYLQSQVEQLTVLVAARLPPVRHSAGLQVEPAGSMHEPQSEAHAPGQPALILKPVERVSNPTPTEFNKMAGNMFVQQPIVIEDAMKGSYNRGDWTREGLVRICGNQKMAYVPKEACAEAGDACHSVREINRKLVGRTWAGLQVTNLTAAGITTLADFMRAQEEVNPGMYIHDAPLVRQCPQLLDHFHAPKYFPNDIKELESRTGIPSNALGFMYHPSLFVGKKGSGSPLHSDADMTRFWLLVMTGSKHVRLISPSENWRSDTRDKRTFQPLIFGVNLMSPDFKRHPQMDGMLVYDTVVKAGELLFIPAGWAHQVINLEDMVATSQNFVDMDAAQLFVHAQEEDMRKLTPEKNLLTEYHTFEVLQDHMTAFYLPILHPEDVHENLKWDKFMALHLLEHAPVPRTVINFVRDHQRIPLRDINAPADAPAPLPQPPNAWTDTFGRSPLHVAARHNFVSVVKYLIEEAGVSWDLADATGATPLSIATDRDFKPLQAYLNTVAKLLVAADSGDSAAAADLVL